ncbi:MAG: hypothetical protein CMG75_05680 [Candidatus Marinimicrobia bacterium]|nr:hypothetical protein [Candidatus Neomarinimicrobiota bacterium]|tara:strand:- start:22614 stop:23903 length:1290 start_codon:yes stop_codon:yes gene_type:complete
MSFDEEKFKFDKKLIKFFLIITLVFQGCSPPPAIEEETAPEPVSERQCLRLLSSAAEYYKNKDWSSTSRVYGDLVDLGCDKGSEEEVFQYWAIAFEFMGKFDSSEYVLLQGLKRLPDNINLSKRLAYAYKRLGNTEKEIFEYEKLTDLIPDDIEPLNRLNELYSEVGRYDDQIFILQKVLEIDPNNKNAQGDLAQAYEATGRDPIDIYRRRFQDNPSNYSFGIDLSDQLMIAGAEEEAIDVLDRLRSSIQGGSSVSNKLILKKLALAYSEVDNLKAASDAYEELFNLDRRDFKTALEIVKVNISLSDYAKAMKWAQEANRTAPENGETSGAKGNVYYAAFQDCRNNFPTNDDKIIAALAYKYFKEAENKGFNRHKRDRIYLENNRDDLVFGKTDWFMLDEDVKRRGSISPKGNCYKWATESIKKDPSWR